MARHLISYIFKTSKYPLYAPMSNPNKALNILTCLMYSIRIRPPPIKRRRKQFSINMKRPLATPKDRGLRFRRDVLRGFNGGRTWYG